MSKHKHDISDRGLLILIIALILGFVLQGVGHYMKIGWLYYLGNASLMISGLFGLAAAFGEWWAPAGD